jgi:DNA-directed RNA polymerase specialized sigma24 family protein
LVDELDASREAWALEIQGPVYRFAYRWCGNVQGAEEIAHDAFV